MKQNLLKILLLLMCFSLTWAGPAVAEMGNSFKTTVDISIMPEYDTSEVLVLNNITFINSSGQAYSGEMRFPVPKGTTNNIVKEIDGSGAHLHVRVEDKGDHAEFVWQPSQPIQPNVTHRIHLEYYYNAIPGTGPKSFNFNFKPSYAVDRVSMQIFQPLKSTDLVAEPPIQLLGTDKQGFQVYGSNYTGVKPNQDITLKVSYNKTDPNPSVQPQGPPEGGVTSSGQFGTVSVLVPLVLLLLAGVVVIIKARQKNGHLASNVEANEQVQEDY